MTYHLKYFFSSHRKFHPFYSEKISRFQLFNGALFLNFRDQLNLTIFLEMDGLANNAFLCQERAHLIGRAENNVLKKRVSLSAFRCAAFCHQLRLFSVVRTMQPPGFASLFNSLTARAASGINSNAVIEKTQSKLVSQKRRTHISTSIPEKLIPFSRWSPLLIMATEISMPIIRASRFSTSCVKHPFHSLHPR